MWWQCAELSGGYVTLQLCTQMACSIQTGIYGLICPQPIVVDLELHLLPNYTSRVQKLEKPHYLCLSICPTLVAQISGTNPREATLPLFVHLSIPGSPNLGYQP